MTLTDVDDLRGGQWAEGVDQNRYLKTALSIAAETITRASTLPIPDITIVVHPNRVERDRKGNWRLRG